MMPTNHSVYLKNTLFMYFIYENILLQSFHPIHKISASDVSIEKFQDGIFWWKDLNTNNDIATYHTNHTL